MDYVETKDICNNLFIVTFTWYYLSNKPSAKKMLFLLFIFAKMDFASEPMGEELGGYIFLLWTVKGDGIQESPAKSSLD